jgi:hypothetical protein
MKFHEKYEKEPMNIRNISAEFSTKYLVTVSINLIFNLIFLKHYFYGFHKVGDLSPKGRVGVLADLPLFTDGN